MYEVLLIALNTSLRISLSTHETTWISISAAIHFHSVLIARPQLNDFTLRISGPGIDEKLMRIINSCYRVFPLKWSAAIHYSVRNCYLSGLLWYRLWKILGFHYHAIKNINANHRKCRIWEMKEDEYTKRIAKNQVCAIFHMRDIRKNVLHKHVKLCTETPCWCP